MKNVTFNVKRLDKEIVCYKCKNKIKHYVYGRSLIIEIILFALVFVYLIGVIPLILYYIFVPKWVCPVCGAKYK